MTPEQTAIYKFGASARRYGKRHGSALSRQLATLMRPRTCYAIVSRAARAVGSPIGFDGSGLPDVAPAADHLFFWAGYYQSAATVQE